VATARLAGLNQAAADLATALTQALDTVEKRADGVDDCLLHQWAPDFPSEAAISVDRELNAATGTPSSPDMSV
jgi:hypothetical protein